MEIVIVQIFITLLLIIALSLDGKQLVIIFIMIMDLKYKILLFSKYEYRCYFWFVVIWTTLYILIYISYKEN